MALSHTMHAAHVRLLLQQMPVSPAESPVCSRSLAELSPAASLRLTDEHRETAERQGAVLV